MGSRSSLQSSPSVDADVGADTDAGEQQPPPPPWREIVGSNDWDNLLDPLNLNLRQLILRCGDFCQATYDAFNNDANSKFAGSSRYGRKSFFQKVLLQDAQNYQDEVSCFLYATARVSVPEAFLLHSLARDGSWDRESNWIGYTAVTTDEYSVSIGRREIYVAFRGTSRNYEWVNILGAQLEPATELLAPSARSQLLATMKRLREKYAGEELSVILTGHSLGACLAILAAFDLVENRVVSETTPVTAIVFGSPQVGNRAFDDRVKSLSNLKILHVRNKIDLLTHYPGPLLGYVSTSTTDLVIDTRKSPSLKESMNTGDWHNLQGMLHVVAGWNGEEGEFELKVKRSLALVNKSSEFLKEEYLIPGSWWVEKNKGMVLDENGEWGLAPPDDEDLPVPPDEDEDL
ncbi:unnamed protein product [Linum tenue]|uniref:Phospholipase A1 n=1 Tax=Linum tenue TaxID=586396 RepID=A0AAV0GX52_9ROSI|nr:unnamed protein product [Linum tenue]